MASDQVEVRLVVGVNPWYDVVGWLRHLDTETADLHRGLAVAEAGFPAQGPF